MSKGINPIRTPHMASVSWLVMYSDSFMVKIETAAVIADSNADPTSVSTLCEFAIGSNIQTHIMKEVITPSVRPKSGTSALGTD